MSEVIEERFDGQVGRPAEKKPGIRFHDLDALRAGAMLLGIVLHAAMSFGTIPWLVQDSQTNEAFTYLFSMIHGFRMPLFFMLSGFFTAMLWRRRGLLGLLKQRAYRIGIPLFVSCLTIIPCMWAVSYVVSQGGSGAVDNPKVWEAIVAGETSPVQVAIEQGEFDVNSVSVDGVSALTVSVFLGHEELVQILIDAGADVNQRNRDGGTALHSAAFVGRSNAVKMLLAAGADPAALDQGGQTAGELLRTDLGTTMYLAGLFGLSLDEEQLLAGRADIAQQLEVDEYLGADTDGKAPGIDWSGLYGLFFLLPVFMHLWFLSFLCWLFVPFLVFSRILTWLPVRRLPKWLVGSMASLIWLIPLTMIPQAWMSPGLFGPDASVGLLPIPSVLAYFAVFFLFGALYWEAEDRQGDFGRFWFVALPLGILVTFPLGYALASGNAPWFAMEGSSSARSLLANFLEAAFAWLMIYGTIGLCRALLSKENRTVRYLSDSSYWLYLTHLPLVILGQYWVRDWGIPSLVKFIGITIVVTAVLLVSYEWCVRYTWIGRILHGERHRSGGRKLAA